MVTKAGVASFAFFLVMAAFVAVQAAGMGMGEMADACDPMQLSPCMGAISGGQEPTPQCCEKLKEQVPCFCGYMNNPALRPYIDSPNSKKVVTGCGITAPSC